MKKVAIITPVLDRQHLHESIKSVLKNQCYLIIVNDSEEPLEIQEKNVTVIDNGCNLGIGISRDRGVQEAINRGFSLIGFVDADSVLSENWLLEIEKALQEPGIVGVSGLALNRGQKSRIAQIKFLLKVYSRRNRIPFQVDCSLFRKQVFQRAKFGRRRYGEDAYFLSQIDSRRLRVNPKAISFHYEVETVRSYFRKEMLGALYSPKSWRTVLKNLVLTPWTSIRMASRRHLDRNYPNAALVWMVRQIIWFCSYLAGRLFGIVSQGTVKFSI